MPKNRRQRQREKKKRARQEADKELMAGGTPDSAYEREVRKQLEMKAGSPQSGTPVSQNNGEGAFVDTFLNDPSHARRDMRSIPAMIACGTLKESEGEAIIRKIQKHITDSDNVRHIATGIRVICDIQKTFNQCVLTDAKLKEMSGWGRPPLPGEVLPDDHPQAYIPPPDEDAIEDEEHVPIAYLEDASEAELLATLEELRKAGIGERPKDDEPE